MKSSNNEDKIVNPNILVTKETLEELITEPEFISQFKNEFNNFLSIKWQLKNKIH